MPAREVAHLRFPIGVIGRVFVQKDDGGSASGFLEIKTDVVARHGVGHSIYLPLFFALVFCLGGLSLATLDHEGTCLIAALRPKIAVNARGCNEAKLVV